METSERKVIVPHETGGYELPPKYVYTADQAKDMVLEYHNEGHVLNNTQLDIALFGLPVTAADLAVTSILKQINPVKTDRHRRRQYAPPKQPAEQLWPGGREFIWTPYKDIRDVVQELELGSHNTLYDLGAGYSRLPMYAAIVTSAACKSIEFVPERVDIARKAKDHLQIPNLEIIQGNVRETEYSDGDVFYMYSPFSKPTAEIVARQLKEIAASKAIRIALRGCNPSLCDQPWLKLVKDFDPDDLINRGYLTIYESR